MQTIRNKALAAVLLSGVMFAAGCSGQGQPSTDVGPHAVAQRIYKQRCLNCHAADLSGKFGPELLTVGSRLTAEEINLVIREGTKGGMPSYAKQLKESEIEALVAWLAEHKE